MCIQGPCIWLFLWFGFFYFWLQSLTILFLRLMHVVYIHSLSFLLLSRNESIIRIQHSTVDDHLHGFHFLTIINMAKSILILDCGETCFYFLWVNL